MAIDLIPRRPNAKAKLWPENPPISLLIKISLFSLYLGSLIKFLFLHKAHVAKSWVMSPLYIEKVAWDSSFFLSMEEGQYGNKTNIGYVQRWHHLISKIDGLLLLSISHLLNYVAVSTLTWGVLLVGDTIGTGWSNHYMDGAVLISKWYQTSCYNCLAMVLTNSHIIVPKFNQISDCHH